MQLLIYKQQKKQVVIYRNNNKQSHKIKIKDIIQKKSIFTLNNIVIKSSTIALIL